MRSMASDAHTATHCEALQEGNDWLGVVMKRSVHAIFVSPEGLPKTEIAASASLVKLRNVTACGECFFALGINDHKLD